MPSDENIIKKYLYEWFLENNSLVIPELGKFETSYMGAKLQPAAHKVLPPNKTIFFDPSQKEDDQVMASFIAEQEGISLQEAQRNIKLFVTTIKAELGIQKKYKVENLGTFIWTPGDTIGFQPDEEMNYLGDSFGLPDLYNLKPGSFTSVEGGTNHSTNAFQANTSNTTTPNEPIILDEEEDDLLNSTFTNKDYVEEPADEYEQSSRGRLFTISTITLLLLSAATAYFLFTDQNPLSLFSGKDQAAKDTKNEVPPAEDSKHLDFEGNEDTENATEEDQNRNAEENTSDTKEEENTSKISPNDPSSEDQNSVVDYATDNSFVSSFVYNPNPPANLNSIMVKTPNSRFYVVLGSFSKAENAYSFYNNLVNRGINTAKIIEPSGDNTYYRVSCLDYATQQEAETQGKAFGKQRNLFVLIYPF